MFNLKQLQQTERKLAEQEGVVSYERHRNTGIDTSFSKKPRVYETKALALKPWAD